MCRVKGALHALSSTLGSNIAMQWLLEIVWKLHHRSSHSALRPFHKTYLIQLYIVPVRCIISIPNDLDTRTEISIDKIRHASYLGLGLLHFTFYLTLRISLFGAHRYEIMCVRFCKISVSACGGDSIFLRTLKVLYVTITCSFSGTILLCHVYKNLMKVSFVLKIRKTRFVVFTPYNCVLPKKWYTSHVYITLAKLK